MNRITHWANRFSRPNDGVACGQWGYKALTNERSQITCTKCLRVLAKRVRDAERAIKAYGTA